MVAAAQTSELARERLWRLQLACPLGLETAERSFVLPFLQPQFHIQVEVIRFPSKERNGGSEGGLVKAHVY